MQWCDIESSVLLGYGVTSLAEQLPTFRIVVINLSSRAKMFPDVLTSVPSNTSARYCFSTSETTHSVTRYRIPVEQILQIICVFEMGFRIQPGTWLDTGFGSFFLRSFAFLILFVFLEFDTFRRVTIIF